MLRPAAVLQLTTTGCAPPSHEHIGRETNQPGGPGYHEDHSDRSVSGSTRGSSTGPRRCSPGTASSRPRPGGGRRGRAVQGRPAAPLPEQGRPARGRARAGRHPRARRARGGARLPPGAGRDHRAIEVLVDTALAHPGLVSLLLTPVTQGGTAAEADTGPAGPGRSRPSVSTPGRRSASAASGSRRPGRARRPRPRRPAGRRGRPAAAAHHRHQLRRARPPPSRRTPRPIRPGGGLIPHGTVVVPTRVLLGTGTAGRSSLVWLVVLVGGGVGAATLAGETSNTFSIPGQESTTALRLIGRSSAPAATGPPPRSWCSPPTARPSPPGERAAVGGWSPTGRLPGVASASDPLDPAAPSVEAGRTTAYSTVTYRVPAGDVTAAERTALLGAVDDARGSGLTAEVTGSRRGTPPDTGGAARRSASSSRCWCWAHLRLAGDGRDEPADRRSSASASASSASPSPPGSSTCPRPPPRSPDARPGRRHRLRAVHRHPVPAGAAPRPGRRGPRWPRPSAPPARRWSPPASRWSSRCSGWSSPASRSSPRWASPRRRPWWSPSWSRSPWCRRCSASLGPRACRRRRTRRRRGGGGPSRGDPRPRFFAGWVRSSPGAGCCAAAGGRRPGRHRGPGVLDAHHAGADAAPPAAPRPGPSNCSPSGFGPGVNGPLTVLFDGAGAAEAGRPRPRRIAGLPDVAAVTPRRIPNRGRHRRAAHRHPAAPGPTATATEQLVGDLRARPANAGRRRAYVTGQDRGQRRRRRQPRPRAAGLPGPGRRAGAGAAGAGLPLAAGPAGRRCSASCSPSAPRSAPPSRCSSGAGCPACSACPPPGR